ncbi:hypothetical protein AA0113_g560 [Alternaria arborescens]|uniref:Uncharacterized protein n=1 Tax=Alternaria arborescens TaxID=156630 RepID=A0A4Q4SQ65_9PLEO|nr:hypothetical protein AA0111_g3279 [Alternaria arborescens]RYO34910.1 hypothetical protein AA0111_g3279 [Alternaria arborescens]RYO73037.1 hypothetical protein AA0113_g560 [Alternaria arborescens]
MAKTTRSPFLDILPPELRLHIYTHLLVAPTSIKGPVARHETKYDLHTAVLRTNKQIYHEARSVFFGKNTFYITSIPPTSSSSSFSHDVAEEEEEGSGAFEPPLQLTDLPSVRHLEVDLLYYPNSMTTTLDSCDGVWKPVSIGARRYTTSLSYLLSTVSPSLLSLTLCADTRRYIDNTSSQDPHRVSTKSETDIERLQVQKLLTGFYMADSNSLLRKAMKDLLVRDVGLHFDFPESYFDFMVGRERLCGQSLVELAGQVLAARSEIRFKAAMQEAGVGNEFAEEGTVNLIPFPCL